ncbi:YmdB family metallophosphoesterase [candidate division WWE3 bacterium]|nr:YmdB family metallophosphoesterase [candidate division WWE3 bacterium]
MRILFIGDIVSRPGRDAVKHVLPGIIKEEEIDFVIANAENLAHGRGATVGTIEEMQDAGVDFFTGGDHLFWHAGFDVDIKDLPVIRPANYPDTVPGEGFKVVETDKGRLLIIDLMGQTFINEPLSNPFIEVDTILDKFKNEKLDGILVEFHGEATSDKVAMGFYLDGRVNALVGTHTHIPTCDEKLLPKGTMYITDIGMTGCIDSVLGVKKEIILDRVVRAKKQKFEWETVGRSEFRSVLVDITTKEIRRVDRKLY